MKNHFNPSRFGLLFRKHTTEHIRTYLMALAVLMGSLFLVMGWAAYASPNSLGPAGQEVFFAFSLMAAGTIFTSTVFANLSGKSRAIATLMLPASQLEKYLVGWLYSFVFLLLVFTGVFYLVTPLILHLEGQQAELINIFQKDNFALSMLFIYSLLHGVAIWGAVAFEKLTFIKTAFGFFIVVALLLVVNHYGLEWMLGRDLNDAIPFSPVSFQEKENLYMVRLKEDQNKLIGLFPLVVAGLLWLAALLRLKEKQI